MEVSLVMRGGAVPGALFSKGSVHPGISPGDLAMLVYLCSLITVGPGVAVK